MDVPGIVEDALEGEEVAARVDLGGDDDLFVTPTRTLIYRSEGLLSDESVESYDHDAVRVDVSEGRRKTKVSLTYAVDDDEEFALPSGRADDAVPAILAGVLHANGVLDAGESVLEVFRFSELTLVVTSERLVKHVGGAVWDEEFEEFHYGDVTGISEEAGSVATQIVLQVAGRAERIKTPNDRAPEVSQRLEEALRAYHDVGEREDLDAALAPETDDEPAEEPTDHGDAMGLADGVDPLDAGDTSNTVEGLDVGSDDASGGARADAGGPADAGEAANAAATGQTADAGSATDQQADAAGQQADATQQREETGAAETTGSDAVESGAADALADEAAGDATSDPATAGSGSGAASSGDDAASSDDAGDDTDPFEKAGFRSAADSSSDLEAEVEELREAVQKQNRLLARQQETIEQLVEELRRGR